MIHAFLYMGVPKFILTDNMKSVALRRDEEGHPVWQKDYELFMGNIGFETRLCGNRGILSQRVLLNDSYGLLKTISFRDASIMN